MSYGRISLLDDATINQIAAGEVIERPASVVKELIENSLDAGATAIRVACQAGGIREIRITDNGHGILPADLPLAPVKHATSKIRQFNDIYDTDTMGFRGEALASIGHVAELSIFSKTPDNEAHAVEVRQGEIGAVSQTPHPLGTSIVVRDLFRWVPVRLNYLKSPAAEWSQIVGVLQQYALFFTEVDWILSNDGEELINTTGIRSVFERVVLLIGPTVRKRLVEVSHQHNGIQVTGCISTPDLNWPNRARQWVAVNRRPVKNALIQKALSDAFSEVVPRGRYPLCVLDVRLQKPGVDVNIHPQKWDVKVRDTSGLYQSVRRAIAEQLQFQSPALVNTIEGLAPAAVTTHPDQLDSMRHQFWADRSAESLQAALWEGPSASDAPFDYWQLFNTYLILKNQEGLWIFDQHAVHERILYAQIRARMASNTLAQPLLIAEMMTMPADLYAVVEGGQDALRGAGFGLEPLGYGQVAVREVPAVLADVPLADLVTDTLFRIREADQAPGDLAQKVARIQQMSCKAAIKAGKPMSALEVRELIRDFYATPANYTCPHGRPLVIRLEKNDLERMFLRR